MESTSFNGCQIYRVKDHMANDYSKHATSKPKCLKCGGLHKIKNCGLMCNYLDHTQKVKVLGKIGQVS